MMKKLKNISRNLILIIASSIVLISCEEVIEIDLNSSNPVLVAEGTIENDSIAIIKLTYTSDYFNNEKSPVEENATVVLMSDDNNSEILTYVADGIYKGSGLIGEVGKTYNLSVTTEKGEYNAQSTLMPPSEIYDIVVSESSFQRPGQSEITYSIELKFKDVSSAKDYYMMKFFVNGIFDSYGLVDDEIFINGDTIHYPVVQKTYYENDEIFIKLHSVDFETYKYYSQLNDAISEGMGLGGSSTPYNPASNFGKNVLGYFAAWSYVSETVVIQ